MSSSFESLIAQFAILLNGGICVPLDKKTPLAHYGLNKLENIAFMIADDYIFQKQLNFLIICIPPIGGFN
jgi:hypothetical protein